MYPALSSYTTFRQIQFLMYRAFLPRRELNPNPDLITPRVPLKGPPFPRPHVVFTPRRYSSGKFFFVSPAQSPFPPPSLTDRPLFVANYDIPLRKCFPPALSYLRGAFCAAPPGAVAVDADIFRPPRFSWMASSAYVFPETAPSR